MEDVFIISAVRTPIGSFNGALANVASHELGATVIQEAVKRASINSEEVSEVIMGQMILTGQGPNPARQASIKAGLPASVPAWVVSMLCGSSMKAVIQGYLSVATGNCQIVVVGGQENASQAPWFTDKRTSGKSPVHTLMYDALEDIFIKCHVGMTAENIARQWGISRDDQDAFAVLSQRRYDEANNNGYFDNELVPVTAPNKRGSQAITKDEFPNPNCTPNGLKALKPEFLKDGRGTVTAGNSSGINDGAAALVMMSGSEAEKRHLAERALGRIVSYAEVGVDPSIMGVGPIGAIKNALAKAGWTKDDLDLIELNEAFAAQSLAVVKDLQLDLSKVNISGGAIALGYPFGAAGARIMVTLLHNMQRSGAKKGLAALCIGGGMGLAICVENPQACRRS